MAMKKKRKGLLLKSKIILFIVAAIACALGIYYFGVGWMAALASSIFLIPQTWKTLRSKDTSGVSFLSNLILLFAVSCWALHGIKIHDTPMIIANLISFVCVFTIFSTLIWREFARERKE
jgi:MtN3 and saliva related transmembrane protein